MLFLLLPSASNHKLVSSFNAFEPHQGKGVLYFQSKCDPPKKIFKNPSKKAKTTSLFWIHLLQSHVIYYFTKHGGQFGTCYFASISLGVPAAAQRAGVPWSLCPTAWGCPLCTAPARAAPAPALATLPAHLCLLQVFLSHSSHALSSPAALQRLFQSNILVLLGPGRTARQGVTTPAHPDVRR